jgi:hypothetical protein
MRVDSDPHFAYESSLSVELSEQKGAMKRLFKTDVPIRRFHKADRTMEVWTQGAAGKRRSGPKIAWPFSLPIDLRPGHATLNRRAHENSTGTWIDQSASILMEEFG